VAHISNMDTMTATGAVLGSPQYMSPEQARSEEVGATSDVFSLGVMLYQLCTGHLPFSGKDPLAVITAILRGQYRRPSEIEPRVSPELEKVIVRCLQSEPAARFPDGKAVAAALRAALDDTRVAAHLEDEETALRRFFDDPAAFEAALAAPVARLAVAAAEQARKSGQISRALAEVGRALAYEPDHAEAQALLARLNARRARPRTVRLAAVAGALLLAGVVAWHPWSGHGPARLPAPAVVTTPAATSPAPAPAPPAEAAPVVQVAPAPALAEPPHESRDGGKKGEATAARVRRRSAPPKSEVAREPAHPAEPVPGSEGPTPSPARGEAPPIVAVTPAGPAPADKAAAPVKEPSPVAKANLALHASYGFCEPSIDEHPPSLRASYRDLTPGPHEIYCTMPQGGAKLHVGTYALRPGARASVVIIPGPDGRPIIGRSE